MAEILELNCKREFIEFNYVLNSDELNEEAKKGVFKFYEKTSKQAESPLTQFKDSKESLKAFQEMFIERIERVSGDLTFTEMIDELYEKGNIYRINEVLEQNLKKHIIEKFKD